jgi:hypothetical protein
MRRVSEKRIRSIVQEEIVRRKLIEEGIWDDVKDGVKKLSQKVTQKLQSSAGDWAKSIKEKLGTLGEMPEDVKTIVSALKAGMAETNESISLDDTLKIAKEIGKEDALAIAAEDLEGPVKDAAASLQKGENVAEVYSALCNEDYISSRSSPINEMGVVTVAGFGLALVGGLPMLFKGLAYLAKLLKAPRLEKLFKKAHHVAHHIEEKVVDWIVPDRLSYAVYKFLNKKGFHVTKNNKLLSYDDFKSNADKSGARKKTDGLIYKALLIFFALNGLGGILKAGASLLGFIEGAATAVKGVELATGAGEVAAIVSATKGVASSI